MQGDGNNTQTAGAAAVLTPLADSGGISLLIPKPTIVSLPGGGVLFEEGERGDCMYIVRSGGLRIRSGNVVYEEVGPGGILGEMAIVERQAPRSATVFALSASELIRIDEALFFALIAETPGFAITVMRVLSRRLRLMDRRHREELTHAGK